MELWDIYDINRNKLNKVIDRHGKEELKDGEYHLVAEAVILNSKGKILIDKRDKSKHKYPMIWECTTGSCCQDETSLQGILRELKEELGLEFKDTEATFYKTVRDDKSKNFKDIWIFIKDIEIENLKFTDGEVAEAKWVTIEEFEEIVNNKEIVPTIDFRKEDYKKCVKIKVK